jgi:hypothetical protein
MIVSYYDMLSEFLLYCHFLSPSTALPALFDFDVDLLLCCQPP